MKTLTLEQKLFLNGFRPDKECHVRILDQEKCRACKKRQCTFICPVEAYRFEDNQLTMFHEGCLECGACQIVCPYDNIDWSYPRGGFGVAYKYG